jgi:hypothetical protein
VSCAGVTTGFGLVIEFIGLFDTASDYALQITVTHRLVFSVTSSLQLLGSGFQRRKFPFLWVPELSPALATSFLQQQLTMTEPQQFSNCLTSSPINSSHPPTNSSLVLLTSGHGLHRKQNLLQSNCCHGIVTFVCRRSRYLATAVVQLLISRSLPSNGSTCHNI